MLVEIKLDVELFHLIYFKLNFNVYDAFNHLLSFYRTRNGNRFHTY